MLGQVRADCNTCRMQLGRRGIGTNEEKEGIDDPAFLMEVMEAREEIEDLDEPEDLQSLKLQYLRKQSGIIQVQHPVHARQCAMLLRRDPWHVYLREDMVASACLLCEGSMVAPIRGA